MSPRTGTPRTGTPRKGPFMRPAAARLLLALALSACGSASGDADDDPELSPFIEGTLISGRVLENSTACVVDALCYLRIEFADTTIVALYGTGERPAPQCEITAEVSDAAFQVESGDIVEVVVSACAFEGHYLQRIGGDAGEARVKCVIGRRFASDRCSVAELLLVP